MKKWSGKFLRFAWPCLLMSSALQNKEGRLMLRGPFCEKLLIALQKGTLIGRIGCFLGGLILA